MVDFKAQGGEFRNFPMEWWKKVEDNLEQWRTYTQRNIPIVKMIAWEYGFEWFLIHCQLCSFWPPNLQTCQLGWGSCKPITIKRGYSRFGYKMIWADTVNNTVVGEHVKMTSILWTLMKRNLLSARVPSSTWQCDAGWGCSGKLFHMWNSERIDFTLRFPGSSKSEVGHSKCLSILELTKLMKRQF